MRSKAKTVRQSVSLSASVATRVRAMATARNLSAAKMIAELIEMGIEAENRRQRQFFELAERFRAEKDPAEAQRLGEELGRMVFGD
jgi:predicted DNA-binding ribbon-helix-helix protein